jgi:hypothetical protein
MAAEVDGDDPALAHLDARPVTAGDEDRRHPGQQGLVAHAERRRVPLAAGQAREERIRSPAVAERGGGLDGVRRAIDLGA